MTHFSVFFVWNVLRNFEKRVLSFINDNEEVLCPYWQEAQWICLSKGFFFFSPLVFCINLTHEKTHFLCQNQVAIFLNFLSLYLSIHFWLCWVFVAAQGFLWLQPVGATLWLRRAGFPSLWLLLLQRTGSRVCRLQELWQEGSAAGAPGL